MSKKAIIVGLDNYPDAPLKGCARDAREIYKLLQRNDDEDNSVNFEARMYNDSDVRTAIQLRKLITDLFKGQHETAFFYFSGHGMENGYGTDLATPDYQKNLGVSIRFLLEAAAQSAIRTKIIILDCCYSGDAGKISTRIPDIMLANNTIILASSRSDEPSAMLTGNEQSVFTNLLLLALKGAAADMFGNISPGSIYAMIDKSLGSFDQRPVFMANVDQFHVLRKVKPSIPLKSIQKIVEYFQEEDACHQMHPSYEFTSEEANPAHIEIFTMLQEMNRCGLVVPVGEKDMYWAAMRKKTCQLTPVGKHYWRLRKNDRF